MSDLKIELHKLCMAYVRKRMETAAQAIDAAQQAANEETKSSAGDKYETGRAMMQQETDRNKAQLNEANKLMVALNHINTGTISKTVIPGSLVITNNGKFYMAISAGTLLLNEEAYFSVSPASPIGLSLSGKSAGNEFTLNGKQYRVESIL
ncbi:MAG TPA: 3-oxoacyl-ACP synthase [Mucilaginibacter sp.]